MKPPSSEGCCHPLHPTNAVAIMSLTTLTYHPTPPHIAAHGLDLEGLAARAVSFQGSGHAACGEPRQDSFALEHGDTWIVAVVADGIGSRRWSHIGSAATANAVAAALAAGADPNEPQVLLQSADSACHDAAVATGVNPEDTATTLTLVVINAVPEPDGSRHCLIQAAGDSPALLLDPASRKWTYITPRGDSPANVVTQWIPGRHDAAFHACVSLPPGTVLVLATDGFTVPLDDGTGILGQDLAARWEEPRELLQFTVDLSFGGYHDDKTIIALWNERPSGAEGNLDGADRDLIVSIGEVGLPDHGRFPVPSVEGS